MGSEREDEPDFGEAMTQVALALYAQVQVWTEMIAGVEEARKRGFTKMEAGDMADLARAQLAAITVALDKSLPFFDKLEVERLTTPSSPEGGNGK